MRRSRAHKAGDHSLCRRCSAVRGDAEPAQAVTLVPQAQPRPQKFDAPAEMRALASRLAAAHEADPANAVLADTLRKTLLELMPKDAGKQDEDLTGLFAVLQA